MSIEVIGIEDLHNNLIQEANKEKNKYDYNMVKEEIKNIVNILKERNPEILNIEKEIIKVTLKNSKSFIIAYPPKYRIKAVETMKDIEMVWNILDRSSYNLLIFYSRKGTLTTSAYLYLGNVMEENEIGILFVNGDEKEINEVFDILEKTGSFIPEEESYVDV
ncbi:hypothetical protein Calag_1547 [Caldisphaera lagunensis DSM 15908]|uniref:Uncharacterized protein n=1 Tax=Caldisphaera lagunensis (strain DSM 15908 / JCM 11604 / ANMR 0165 / IC-154) TaxID=1056495 RepID=L0ADW7_CALLD|nr:hypothetical protein [Caldisphaera lagunensis]AFZ71245.1 hypothetical protein Calag_1547 [Caldisphaera lagunensis DSM 15908]